MYGFDRLIKEMDKIAGRIKEEVIIQIGEATYEPKNTKYFKFMSRDKMEELYKNARVIVCHAGVGTIITALQYNKPIILVPRMKKYGEVFDDHQFEICSELEKEGIAIIVYDIENLESAIENVKANIKKFKSENTLAKKLKEYLDYFSKAKR
jgi:UDP-N-acetylglucosamine transferase subunit ALG13